MSARKGGEHFPRNTCGQIFTTRLADLLTVFSAYLVLRQNDLAGGGLVGSGDGMVQNADCPNNLRGRGITT